MYKEAVISDDQLYRYTLYREWAEDPMFEGVKVLNFVMLNPSTADASVDDPTIRKCVGFAKCNGFNAIRVVNLFAYRATNPKDLLPLGDQIFGPDNDSYIREIPTEETVVAAWGSFPYPHNWLYRRVESVVKLLDRKLWCVKKSGPDSVPRPWHPLYVPYGPLIEF